MKILLEDMAQPYLLRIIEEDKEAIKNRTTSIWESKRDDIMLEGFRKGHVPQHVAEGKFGFSTLYESYVNQLILDSIEKVRSEQGKTVVDLQQVYPEKLSKEGIVLQAIAYLKPSVEVDYTYLQVERKDTSSSAEEVAKELASMQESASVLVPVVDRGLNFGDTVIMSFAGSINGVPFDGGTASNQRITLQTNSFIPGFSEQLLGLNSGESATISVTFPTDYRVSGLAGQNAQFDVSIHEIYTRQIPELNDDFAKEQNHSSLAELAAKVEQDIVARKAEVTRAETESVLVTQLLSKAAISPIPQTMIERYLNQMLQQQLAGVNMTEEQFFKKANSSKEQFNQTYYHIAKRDIKVQLILDYIAAKENFVVSSEERDAYLASEAARLGLAVSSLVDMTTTEQIDSRVKMRKAYDYLLENAVYVDANDMQGNVVGQ